LVCPEPVEGLNGTAKNRKSVPISTKPNTNGQKQAQYKRM